MKDSPEAPPRAAVLLYEVIVHQQVVAAPSPGAVGVTGRSGWQPVVHPGGDLRQRLQVHMEEESSACRMTLSLSLPLFESLPCCPSVCLRKNAAFWVPLYFYIQDTLSFTDVQGQLGVMTAHAEANW